MTRFDDALAGVVEDGTARAEATPVPADYATEVVTGVRRVRRRRTAGGAVAVAVVAAVAVAGLVRLAPPDVEPANPVTTQLPGEVVWSVPLGDESWSAPAVWDGLAIVGANDGSLRAVDIGTGETAWETVLGGGVRSEPLPAGDVLFVNADDGLLYRLDSGGDITWSATVSEPVIARDTYSQRSSRPALVGDLVVAASARDGLVRAFDAASGELAWEFATRAPVTGDLATDGSVLAVPGEDSNLYLLDGATGLELWSQPMGSPITSSPAFAEGLVISGSRGSEVVAFAVDTGERVWSVPMPGGSWAESSVAVAGGQVFFGSSSAGAVFSADAATGEILWSTEVGGWPWPRPAVTEDEVYVTFGSLPEHLPWDAAVEALDRESGTPWWRAETGAAQSWRPSGEAYGSMAAPAVTEHVVLVSGLDGVLYAFAR